MVIWLPLASMNIAESLKDDSVHTIREALARYNATRYTVEDCRSCRSVTEYLATLEAAASACGLGSAQKIQIDHSGMDALGLTVTRDC